MAIERIQGRLSEEQRERERRDRELIDAERDELSALADELEPPELRLSRQLRELAEEARLVAEHAERGEVPPVDHVRALRQAVDKVLASTGV
jgi:glutathione synthase/RimK-type ligase-like ATP-grasp enzyme